MTEIIMEPTPEIMARFAAARKRYAAEKPKPAGNLFSSLPESIKARAAQANAKNAKHEYLETDDRGQVFVSRKDLRKLHVAEALERHGNDPNKRLDECGFPGSRRDRKFALTHNFGKMLPDCLAALKDHRWVYAYGNVGQGKTALMVRLVWELIKDRPTSRASFISVNDYVREAVRRESRVQAALRKGDEIDPDTGAQPLRNLVVNIYCLLSLIEKVKKRNAWVLITAQYSIAELLRRHGGKENVAPLCDRLREMCYVLPKFQGKSKRGLV
jgi:DNA replication protein DnaC